MPVNYKAKYEQAQADIMSFVKACTPVVEEVTNRLGNRIDSSYDPTYHVEITLTARECRRIQDLVDTFSEGK